MKMHAMLLKECHQRLIYTEIEKPLPKLNQILLKVTACGICRHLYESFSYDLLWGERTLCSIANLTRKDGEEFLSLAPSIPIKTEIHTYSLQDVNQALDDLRYGQFTGAAVVMI